MEPKKVCGRGVDNVAARLYASACWTHVGDLVLITTITFFFAGGSRHGLGMPGLLLKGRVDKWINERSRSEAWRMVFRLLKVKRNVLYDLDLRALVE